MRGWIVGQIYYKNEDEDQKLKMGGYSWTINVKEIGRKLIETVEYRTVKAIYRIPYATALTKGFMKNFQGELKLIVPVRFWEVILRK